MEHSALKLTRPKSFEVCLFHTFLKLSTPVFLFFFFGFTGGIFAIYLNSFLSTAHNMVDGLDLVINIIFLKRWLRNKFTLLVYCVQITL